MRNPFPLSPSARWAIAAWIVYLLSYAMPARTEDVMMGCQAAYASTFMGFGQLIGIGSGQFESIGLASIFWTLSNLAFLASPFLIRRPRMAGPVVLPWVYSAMALTPFLALLLFKDLGSGFFLWWVSFVLLFIAFYKRPVRTAVKFLGPPKPFQFGLATLLMLTLTFGALIGLNLAIFRHLAATYKMFRDSAFWMLPFHVVSSFLALLLVFDFWEARRLRAGSAAK